MKKLRINLFMITVLTLMSVFSLRVFAMSPPYLSLETSKDVITKDNAILNATLNNVEGKTVTGFEIFLYRNEVFVKSGVKSVNSSDATISIEFDLNKDLSVELMPETKYTYIIYAKVEGNVVEDMYKQMFWFTTTNTDVKVTTIADETTANGKLKNKEIKPANIKIKSIKNIKKKSIKIKFNKVKNAKKYQIQYALNRKFKKVITKNTKKNTYTIKKLKKGKTYYIRVRGVNGKKKGNWSKTKKIVINK